MVERAVKMGSRVADAVGVRVTRPRRLLPVLLVVATMWAAPPAAADELVQFDGGGWGHGVGMSQYGARAMAASGHSAEQIIGFYYPGSTVQSVEQAVAYPSHFLLTDPEPLWLNLMAKVGSVDVIPFGAAVGLCDGETCVEVPQGQRWRIRPDGAGCRVGPVSGWPSGSIATGCALDTDRALSPTQGIEVPGACVQATCRYGRGVFHVRAGGQGLHALLELDLDEYLFGLAEMPSSWPNAALQAQAIAGRSYAVSRIHASGPETKFSAARQQDCWCHLVDTISDQAYTGLAKEQESSGGTNWGARWRQAVLDSAGKVATHPEGGQLGIISTFYSSSNGGWTEAIEDVWGGDPRPYLVAKEDPWSISPAAGNPHASWTADVPISTIAARLGWDQLRSAVLTSPAPGAQVRFGGRKDGSNVSQVVSGYTVRSWFGLRSGGLRSVKFVGPGGFSDIFDTVHALDIVRIAEEGITRGCNPPTNDRFCPEESITRGQLAAFLVRAMGLPPADPHGFVDAQGHLFSNDIARISAAGITRGCNPPANDRFCPDQSVTRGQAAAFFARALELDPVEGSSFVDTAGSVFSADIEKLASTGLTRGCNPPANDRFCPERTITRAEFATFLARAFLG